MTISPEFFQSELPTDFQKFLLVLLALFVPPLPIYLLSGPRHSFKTKEFIISCLLTILFFMIGVFYSIIFILSIYPSARAEAGREGYIRVGDSEAQVGDQEISHQSGDIEQPEIQTHTLPEPSPYHQDYPQDKSSSQDANEPLLPSYEEIEGNSRGDSRNDSSKFGDNKVQH